MDQKKETVKSIILSLLERMETKKIQGVSLTNDEVRWISGLKGLTDYVYSQNTIQIVSTERNGENTKAKIDKEKMLEISESTIYKAIRELQDDQLIEIENKCYQIKHTDTERYAKYPILKIAPQLSVTHLPIENLAVFRVPIRYAEEIAHYLNDSFFSNDIYTVAISGLIICMDIALPSKSKYAAKKGSVEKRVKKKLKEFNMTKYTDKEIAPGYEAEELEIKREKEVLKAMEASIKDIEASFKDEVPSYGGNIENRPVRKVKCKKVTKRV